MICLFCKTGEPRPDRTVITLQRGECTVIIKNVPADVCPVCGESYLSAELTKQLSELASAAFERGAEVEILRFAA